jgi:adenylate kinase family enzyme
VANEPTGRCRSPFSRAGTVPDVRLEDARRWLVVGNSGSGKTTVARRVAGALDLPRTELDAVHWQADWTANPRFVEEIALVADAPSWVIDGFYPPVRPLLAARAEVLVWLDLPAPLILWRVTRRTILRSTRGVELWNGNREPPLRTFFTDDEHVIRWAFRTLRDHAVRTGVREALAANPALRLVRLRSQRDVDRLVALLPRTECFAA